MPCDYCGKPLSDSGSCPSNPWSDFHVGKPSREEIMKEAMAKKCSYCGKPVDSPEPCSSNPWSDFHV